MDRPFTPNLIQEAELERLMLLYGSRLYRLCYLYLHDASLAEDAVQDTFVKAYKGMSSFQERREGGEKAWLTRIAINTCKDYRRSAWFRYVDRRVTPEDLPPAIVPNARQYQPLALEIMNLPSKYKEIILLYYYQDMTMDEIGHVLGIAKSTVSFRLQIAKEKLHGKLKEWYVDE